MPRIRLVEDAHPGDSVEAADETEGHGFRGGVVPVDTDDDTEGHGFRGI